MFWAMDLQSWVYILASKRNGTLYTGVTTNLLRRVWEHREGVLPGFTKTYGVKMLVWCEVHGDVLEAIAREKAIKRWRREWKLALIEAENPRWLDLYETMNGGPVDLSPTRLVIPGGAPST
ncbi:MAG: GIY-YIG nuclease family protein [Caulobacteraceae bacterium]